MSHEVKTMAYTGETPWHGLGVSLPADTSLDEWHIRAGLTWNAVKRSIRYTDASGVECSPANRFALIRDDNGRLLNIVSDRYQPVQPATVMDFYAQLCEAHGFAMETAGVLKGGRIVWALARTGEGVTVADRDVIKGYVLLSTSYDGSAATTARHTAIHVVCNNTLSLATADKPAITIRHNTTFRPDAVRKALGIGKAMVEFRDKAQLMAMTPISNEAAVKFFMDAYRMGTEQPDSKRGVTLREAFVERLARQYLQGPGAQLDGARGTVWGAVNAVTHDIGHVIRARTDDHRLTSAWFGAGAAIKARAWDAALAMAA